MAEKKVRYEYKLKSFSYANKDEKITMLVNQNIKDGWEIYNTIGGSSINDFLIIYRREIEE